jgi:hypothetical protein
MFAMTRMRLLGALVLGFAMHTLSSTLSKKEDVCR